MRDAPGRSSMLEQSRFMREKARIAAALDSATDSNARAIQPVGLAGVAGVAGGSGATAQGEPVGTLAADCPSLMLQPVADVDPDWRAD